MDNVQKHNNVIISDSTILLIKEASIDSDVRDRKHTQMFGSEIRISGKSYCNNMEVKVKLSLYLTN
jgi:hypothetical protein